MPKPLSPWDRPPRAESSATKKDICAAVGEAMSNWALVEFHLWVIFSHIFHGSKSDAAIELYASIPTLNSKINAIKRSGKVFLKDRPEHWEYLEICLRKVEQFSGRRNDIAHGMILGSSDGFTLIEPIQNNLKLTGYSYTAESIEATAQWFQYLSLELMGCSSFFQELPLGAWLDTPLSPYLQPQKEQLQKEIGANKTAGNRG